MMVLALLRVPIAISMGVVGFLGVAYLRDWNFAPAMAMVETKVYETGRNYTLSVVPLFILMGNFVTRAGMSQELFRAAYTFVGHLRGGLAMATVVRLRRLRRDLRLVDRNRRDHGQGRLSGHEGARLFGSPVRRLGRGGRNARHPDSAIDHHGDLRGDDRDQYRQAVRRRHPAGNSRDLPALSGRAMDRLPRPRLRPARRKVQLGATAARGRGVWAVALLFFVVMGGIYGGVFTATEGAGIGAFGALCFALARRALSWRTLLDALVESGRTTAMLFAILTGALMFAEFVNYTTLPDDLKSLVTTLNLSPIMVITAICAIYVILGTAMEELSMILLTVPVFFPLVVHLGFDPIWFGILIVVVVEIGLISPPVGMNLFVLNALLPQVSTRVLFEGVMPFVVADVVRLGILIAFPAISLWLPSLMR